MSDSGTVPMAGEPDPSESLDSSEAFASDSSGSLSDRTAAGSAAPRSGPTAHADSRPPRGHAARQGRAAALRPVRNFGKSVRIP